MKLILILVRFYGNIWYTFVSAIWSKYYLHCLGVVCNGENNYRGGEMTVERIQGIASVLCDFVNTHEIGARGFILEVPKVIMPEESLYLKRWIACQLRKTMVVRYGGIFCSVKGDYMKMKIPADLLRDSDTV